MNSILSLRPWRLALSCAFAAVGLIRAAVAAADDPAVPLPAAPAVQPAAAAAGLPTIFVCGDSTARNNANGALGWGTPLADYFDPAKVIVENVAHAGTSSRTYMNGDWPKVLPRIKAGDFVLVVFGINDGGPPRSASARGSIPGIGDETVELPRPDGTIETAHTYGWYMARYISDARAKGARVYVLTVTARNIWNNPKAKFRDATITSQEEGYNPAEDHVERGTSHGDYTKWSAEVAEAQHAPLLNLTFLLADKYDQMGREKVMVNFLDHNHTKPAGADIVAASVVSGLKAFPNSPFLALLSDKGRAVETADPKYVSANEPRVALPLKSSDVPRLTQIGAAAPQPVTETPPPAAGTPPPGKAPRGPRIALPVPADPKLPTLVLIGDSTVRNGVQGDGSEKGQWGWGAPLTAFFDLTKINLINRAMGGTSSRSYYNTLWKETRELVKPGDVVIMQFGHNDNGSLANDPRARATLPGAGEETQLSGTATVHTFGWYVRQYVKEIRAKGATPIICSLIPRRHWGEDGRVRRDLASHAGWAAQVAKEENVDFIDLNERIARRYDELGREKVMPLFSPAETENVHTGWDGAVLNAEIVVSGLKALKADPLAPYFSAVAQGIAPADLSSPAPAPKPSPASAAAASAPATAPAPKL
jgi:lysophospholipase L1-like esterase